MSFDQADCVTELSTSKIDILKNLDAFMLICNSLQYSVKYTKTNGSFINKLEMK